MSLTSRIQALTAYANEVTGESDTTLADAVATLAEGYGQGGGISLDDIASGTAPSGNITINSNMRSYAFFNCQNIRRVTLNGNTADSCLGSCGITELFAPNINAGVRMCQYSRQLTKIVVKSADTASFNGCTALQMADIVNGNLVWQCFNGCTALTTLILRKTTIATINNINVFGGTPFKSDGTGGTIYIPKALYDELGTGSTLDYKSATNWSTIDGYGTITWAPIEGSIYETQYADGTPILM